MKKIYILIIALFNNGFCFTQCLVAYYPFNSNILDYSGNNNNGIFTNASLVNDHSGNPNSAYVYDGISQYTVLPALNFTSELTISAWVMITTNDTAQQDIITKYDADIGVGNQTTMRSFRISRESAQYGSQFDFQTTDNASGNWHTSSVTVPIPNQWYHVAGTFNNGISKIYINGVLETMHSASYQLYNSTVNILCAASYSDYPTPDFFASVAVDELRLYDCALTDAEILNIYTSIKENTVSNGFTIYPNPVSTQININLKTISSEKIKIEIVNQIGQTIKIISASSSQKIIAIPVADVPNSIYFVKISDSKKIISKKISVIH